MVGFSTPDLLWSDLKPEHLAQLDAAGSSEAVQTVLAEVLNVADEPSPIGQQVLLEFYTHLISFANEAGFSTEKTSTFFSLMKRTHDEMVETFMPANQTYEYFKALLLQHSVQRPPHSVGIFGLNDAKAITSYALEHYFRMFQLYRYAFTMRHVKAVSLRTSWAELPPASFPPLADGVPCAPLDEMPADSGSAEAVSAAPVPDPPAPPDLSELNLAAEVISAVQEQLTSQVDDLKKDLDRIYSERTASLEAMLARLEPEY